MTISATLDARELIIAALKADSAFTDFVPEARVYPNKTPSEPQKPYSRLGPPTSEPERLSGWDGSVIDCTLHVFAAPTDDDPDPEKFVGQAIEAAAKVIDDLPYAFVTRTMCRPDRKDPDVWHGSVEYEATQSVPRS